MEVLVNKLVGNIVKNKAKALDCGISLNLDLGSNGAFMLMAETPEETSNLKQWVSKFKNGDEVQIRFDNKLRILRLENMSKCEKFSTLASLYVVLHMKIKTETEKSFLEKVDSIPASCFF